MEYFYSVAVYPVMMMVLRWLQHHGVFKEKGERGGEKRGNKRKNEEKGETRYTYRKQEDLDTFQQEHFEKIE